MRKCEKFSFRGKHILKCPQMSFNVLQCPSMSFNVLQCPQSFFFSIKSSPFEFRFFLLWVWNVIILIHPSIYSFFLAPQLGKNKWEKFFLMLNCRNKTLKSLTKSTFHTVNSANLVHYRRSPKTPSQKNWKTSYLFLGNFSHFAWKFLLIRTLGIIKRHEKDISRVSTFNR